MTGDGPAEGDLTGEGDGGFDDGAFDDDLQVSQGRIS